MSKRVDAVGLERQEKRYVYTVDLKTEFFKKRQTDRIKLWEREEWQKEGFLLKRLRKKDFTVHERV